MREIEVCTMSVLDIVLFDGVSILAIQCAWNAVLNKRNGSTDDRHTLLQRCDGTFKTFFVPDATFSTRGL